MFKSAVRSPQSLLTLDSGLWTSRKGGFLSHNSEDAEIARIIAEVRNTGQMKELESQPFGLSVKTVKR